MEELLEQLVAQNESILEGLQDVVAELKEINGELNWVQEHSFAKVAVDGLEEIARAIRDSSP
jgi:hypothetical protein